MSRIILGIACGIMAVTLVPSRVMASPPCPGNAVGGSAGASASAAGPHGATRYCVVETFIGLPVAKKACLTRDEWLKRGFDPLQ